MAKKFDTKGLGTILRNAAQLEQAIKESPEEVVKEVVNHVIMLPIEFVEANPEQPREHFDKEALENLAASIRTHGLIQPITVRRLHEKAYQIISGERRFRASKMAGLDEIPAYVRIVMNDQDLLEMALIENIQRADLNSMEIANSYATLIKSYSLTHEQISQRVGKDRTTITNYIRLFDLPIDAQTALKEEKISMGHAKALLSVKDNFALFNVILNRIVEEGLSVRATENLVRSLQGDKKPAAAPAPKGLPENLRQIRDRFRDYFHTSHIDLKRDEKGKGQIVIKFDNDNELNRIIEMIEDK